MEKYDLFVSYVDADRAWVEGYLLNVLEAADVHYHSEEAFVLGAVRLQEFERAIQQSHRVLLVLSNAYLADNLSQFIDLLAQCFGLDNQTWPVIPLLLEPIKLPPRLSVLIALDASREEKWEGAIARLCKDLKRAVPTAPTRPACPYPGMLPFREKNKNYFFGRNQEIQAALKSLRLHPFLTVIGPSGSGKSSFVFAGLLPALQQSKLMGTSEWQIRVMRPGETPQTTLKRTVIPADIKAPLVMSGIPTHRTLLVIDQFEELFTTSGPEKAAFEKSLLRFMQFPHCYLVLTVRADFYPDLMTCPLWHEIRSHRLEIVPLDESGLRQSIVQPAESVGVFVEPALVERLITDAAGEPGVLPLLQETLVLLWERIERRLLPLRAYEEVLVLSRKAYEGRGGEHRTGLMVAIAQRADAALADLNDEQESIARRILLRLIQFGEGRPDTRRQQLVPTLKSAADRPQQFNQTLQHLTNRRLLTLTGETIKSGETTKVNRKVDIAHEALITSWPTLQEWISERRDAEQVRRRLTAKAEEWLRLDQAGGLLDEIELAEAQRWMESTDARDLGDDESLVALMQASRTAIQTKKQQEEAAQQRELSLIREALEQEKKAKQQERKAHKNAQARNRLGAIAAIALILALSLFGLFYLQRQYAKVEEIKSLNATSEVQLTSHIQLESLLTSLKAAQILKQTNWLGVDNTTLSNLKMQTIATLQQAVELTQEVNRLEGHTLRVNNLSISPDGQTVASAGDDATLRIWKSDGTLLHTLKESDRVTSVAFSPDGQTIAAAGANGSLKLWSLEGTLKKTLVEQGEWINSVAWNRDGSVAIADRQGLVKLWSPDGTFQGAIQVPGGSVNAIAFSPDGQTLATAGGDAIVRTWNGVSRVAIAALAGHTDGVAAVAFNPVKTELTSAGLDGKILVWNLLTQQSRVLGQQPDWVNSVQYSPDGKFLLSANQDGTLKLWQSEEQLAATEGNANPLLGTVHNAGGAPFRSAVFHPSESTLLSASETGRISVWNSNLIDLSSACRMPALAIDFSPDDQMASIDSTGTVQIQGRGCEPRGERLEPASEQKLLYSSNKLTAASLKFDTDNQIVAAGYDNNMIQLWNFSNRTPLKLLTENQSPTSSEVAQIKINSLSFHPTENLLAAAGDDKTIRLWNLSSFSIQQVLTQHQDAVSSAVFSPNGKLLGSGSYDGTVGLWQQSGQTFQFWKSLQVNPEGVTAVAFSPDNQAIAAASASGIIQIWKVGEDKPQQILAGHQRSVIYLAFSRNNATLISGSDDNMIKFWNYREGTLVKTLLNGKALAGDMTSSALSISFSPDETLLASANETDGLLLRTLVLDSLLKRGCDRLQPYLQVNSQRTAQPLASICPA